MANNSNKKVYIIIGVVLLVLAVPVLLVILGALGGIFYTMQGAAK